MSSESEEEDASGGGSGSEVDEESSDATTSGVAVAEDLQLLHDLVLFMDQTSLRIGAALAQQRDLRQIQERFQQLHAAQTQTQQTVASRPAESAAAQIFPQNYESLSEAQRARLLEQALLALALPDPQTPPYRR